MPASVGKGIDSDVNEAESTFLTEQARSLLHAVDETLRQVPPQLPEPRERRLALLTLDGVLHDEAAPFRPPVQQFLHRRIGHAVMEIEQCVIEDGARIWKLYNHGFVIRTATVTLGFDLVRGTHIEAESFAVEEAAMQRLVDQCDVLFISHRHGDHADPWVAQAFLEQNKPVLCPPVLWLEEAFGGAMTRLPREAHQLHRVALQNGDCAIEVAVYPGDHGGATAPVNNVYLVTTPDGLGFCHTGDQHSEHSFAWIDEVRHHHRVDVLMPNCWTCDIVRMARGMGPQLVVTGHENELGHTIDHREPYWLSYERQTGSERWGGRKDVGYSQPLVLMTWGESYHYTPA